MNKTIKVLLKIDLAVYVIFSLGMFILGIMMVTSDRDVTSTSKNLNEGFQFLGWFTLSISIILCVVTYLKIQSTLKEINKK